VQLQYIILILVLLFGVVGSIWARKLTVMAALTGGVIGVALFYGARLTGLFLMGTFFVLGTVATSWKRRTKEVLDIAEENKGRRKTSQVLANAGLAGLAAVTAKVMPQNDHLFQLMMAACFSSATADTLSSELGSVYGKWFYNILTFKRDKRGLDGVVSWEGILIGIAGSAVIAIIYAAGFGWNICFLWIVVAGTVGNLSDSVLGATLERRGVLHNDAVNFLNTLVAALVVAVFYGLT
jgi:uncharacterized protein (TIGR00297 family)